MKKLLPILFLSLSFFVISAFRTPAFAAPTPTPTVSQDIWLPDSEVTFAGKSVVRAKDFFDWTLTNYAWATSDATVLSQVWGRIRNIVFALLILVVVGAASAILVTRGRNVGVFEFLKRFFLAIVLILFSYALIRFMYQLADVIQGFFLHNPDGTQLGVKDLLNISFSYDFQGYRRVGDAYTESAFISILLTKLTAITYNTMAGLLLVRKVIMWFFIAVSPIFPLLLLYYPLKNTAKIWLAEFFRWVLYAPLFAIFLSGLVALWKSQILLLPFQFGGPSVYAPAINILLGGPGQSVSLSNSLNTNGTYAQYVVALIMLWIVMLLPFLLLRIFLDYLGTLSLENMNGSASFRLFRGENSFLPSPVRTIPAETVVSAAPVTAQIAGSAQSTSNRPLAQYGLESLKIPTLKDIAVFDHAAQVSSTTGAAPMRNEADQIRDTLQKIAVPERVTPAIERQQFANVKQDLEVNEKAGDAIAASILAAARHTANGVSRSAPIPSVNRVQSVNPRDLSAVRGIWLKNYMSAQPPADTPRTDWIKKEKEEAERATKLLSSDKTTDVAEGKNLLSHVMSYLLAGGFSLKEIIDYLKAKADAANDALKELTTGQSA